ncbi:hypothetical protein BDR03DRAFT_451131 [Suillus americanus]|nr:hypothetical protein BDR03DRAFT_451131 [Suillus americanus]
MSTSLAVAVHLAPSACHFDARSNITLSSLGYTCSLLWSSFLSLPSTGKAQLQRACELQPVGVNYYLIIFDVQRTRVARAFFATRGGSVSRQKTNTCHAQQSLHFKSALIWLSNADLYNLQKFHCQANARLHNYKYKHYGQTRRSSWAHRALESPRSQVFNRCIQNCLQRTSKRVLGNPVTANLPYATGPPVHIYQCIHPTLLISCPLKGQSPFTR